MVNHDHMNPELRITVTAPGHLARMEHEGICWLIVRRGLQSVQSVLVQRRSDVMFDFDMAFRRRARQPRIEHFAVAASFELAAMGYLTHGESASASAVQSIQRRIEHAKRHRQ
jgi:hypothetical protein